MKYFFYIIISLIVLKGCNNPTDLIEKRNIDFLKKEITYIEDRIYLEQSSLFSDTDHLPDSIFNTTKHHLKEIGLKLNLAKYYLKSNKNGNGFKMANSILDNVLFERFKNITKPILSEQNNLDSLIIYSNTFELSYYQLNIIRYYGSFYCNSYKYLPPRLFIFDKSLNEKILFYGLTDTVINAELKLTEISVDGESYPLKYQIVPKQDNFILKFDSSVSGDISFKGLYILTYPSDITDTINFKSD